MKLKPFLIPRLNYDFSFKDMLVSFFSLFTNISQKKIEELYGNKNIYFLNHARTALKIVLSSLNLKKGARVGVQVYNCHTVFQAIKESNFVPVFIDVDENLRIDLHDLKIKKQKLDALIITHLFGFPAPIDEIKVLSGNIPIIEDCAHSFLSKYKYQFTGTFGDAGVFSMGHGKFPSIGDGGMIIINNHKLINPISDQFERLRKPSTLDSSKNILKNFVFSMAHKRPIYGLITNTLGRALDKKLDLGKKKQFTEMQICRANRNIFLYKFEHHLKNVEQQKHNAQKVLSSSNKWNYMHDKEKNMNYFMLPFICKERDRIIDYSIGRNIEFGKHFSQSLLWASEYGYLKNSCPKSETLVDRILTVPCYYRLKSKHMMRIKSILKIFEKTNS